MGIAQARAHRGGGAFPRLKPWAIRARGHVDLGTAITVLGQVQGDVGSAQNTLIFALNLASTQVVNFSAAESRIRDADIALEASNPTKASIRQQAGIAALAQANTAPQSVLALLQE